MPAATKPTTIRYAPAMPGQKPDDPTVHEETDSPTYADDRMFYKVEKWTRDGTKVVTACFMPATASVELGQCSKGLSSIGLVSA